MKFTFLSILAILVLAFTSCQKEKDDNSDAQLILAIQKATNKQNIDIGALPSPSRETLANDYTEDYIDIAKFAPKLGYEVDMRKEKGPWVGERQQTYFDLNGRQLKGWNKGDKDDWDKGDKYRKACFELMLPISFEMPDGLIINIEEKQDWTLIKDWYTGHPDESSKPDLQYPVDIKFYDEEGSIVTINNSDEMKAAYERCKDMNEGGGDKVRCFEFVFPVTFILPDGSTVTVNDKDELKAARMDWKENGIRPTLQFPVDILFKGETKTINSKEEMFRVRQVCKKGSWKRCFTMVLPVTYSMPDGSDITIETKEDWILLKTWYDEHPDFNEKPVLQYPVDIKWKNGEIQTINTKEEMMIAKKKCSHHFDRCFMLIYPVTYGMPDGSYLTLESKEDHQLLKQWYQENPGYDQKPVLQYPVDIKWKDGSVQTINSEEEMIAAKEDCNGD